MLLDLSNVKVEDGFDVLPEGKYVCSITNVEVKDTKAGTGQYVKTELTVVDGEAKGRKIFSQFNIKNPNMEAVAIGMKQLKQMLSNSTYPNPEKVDLTKLTGTVVGVKTKITKSTDFGDKAEVHYFFTPKAQAGHQDLSQSNIPF
jgi:hypothetical protein